MTRTNRMTTALAAGLLAVAGLAAPAAAQSSTTSISVDDGEIEGYSVRIIDGTKYKIEFDGDGVHTAYIDGDEVDFKSEEDVVYIVDGGELIEFEVPKLGAAGNAFTIGRAVGEQLALVNPGQGNNQFWLRGNEPKTMVGLTQSTLDDQLREHLALNDGVGTMILSVVEGLPAAKAGLKHGDVLINVAGRKVTGAAVLTDELSGLKAGDELDVIVLRKGLPESLTIEVAAFDAEKLYGGRLPFGNAQGEPNAFRWDVEPVEPMDFDFDFEDLEDLIRDELADIKDLDDDQREELDRAMAQAREQIAHAMEQAERARMLRWNLDRGNELLLRNADDERALLIEREALRDHADRMGNRHPEVVAQRQRLEERMHELELRKRELDERREEVDERVEELRERNRELTEQNHELRERLNSLEHKLDRLLAHLEDLEDRGGR